MRTRPSHHELWERLSKPSSPTVHSASRSQSAMFAAEPGASEGRSSPNGSAPPDIRSTTRARSRTPGRIRSVWIAANAVSRPVTPIAACSNGTSFSSGWCGAWSVAMHSIVPSFLSAICYGILIVAFPTMIPGAAALPTDSQAREVVISALILSPIIGSFFAAGAAWYRRFLAMSSPNRQRKASQTPKQKPGDGRTRTGSTQKAGAKR